VILFIQRPTAEPKTVKTDLEQRLGAFQAQILYPPP
jgi:hypothetical protein